MNKYYFTFSKNSPQKNEVAEVLASTIKEAIGFVEELYGNDWYSAYTEYEWQIKNSNVKQ